MRRPERVAAVYVSLQRELWRHAGFQVRQGKPQLWSRSGAMLHWCEAMMFGARSMDETASVWRSDPRLPPH